MQNTIIYKLYNLFKGILRTVRNKDIFLWSNIYIYIYSPIHVKFVSKCDVAYTMLNTILRLLFYHWIFNFLGAAGLFFILMTPYIYGKTTLLSQFYVLLYSVHHITSIICLLCSAIYHLMMCHNEGENVYRKLLGLDMLGIWLVMSFSCITFIRGTFFCFPQLYKLSSLVYFLIAGISLIFILKGRSSAERLVPLIPIGCTRGLLYATRVYMAQNGYTTANPDAVWYLVAMELFGILGSLINTSRFPEKWLGGKLDYLLNSHNIMHIIVLICPILLHLATVADFKWLETAKCPSY